jgi:hypothetical protein
MGLPTRGGPQQDPGDIELRPFGVKATRQYRWDETYDTSGYLQVLNTYSGHRSLGNHARELLFQGTADLIDQQFGGSITKDYLTTLYVAHRA